MNDYQANIYPGNGQNPTIANADKTRKNIAVCLSGGGSRALTCAWGQLLGLGSLKDENGKPLIDDVRYISSVSGGSWAAVLYTFRPENIPEAVFLGKSYSPEQLYYDPSGQSKPGELNVCSMGDTSMGKVPQNFSNLFTLDPKDNILTEFITLTLLKGIRLSKSAKWLWMYIVGKNVLADYGLYTFKNSLIKPKETPWNFPDAKYFSLSAAYADSHIFSKAKAPPKNAFVYARTDATGKPNCPMLIVNTNVVGQDCSTGKMSGPLQIPTQVSPVAAGINGDNPCNAQTLGGGGVESFAFTSTLSAAPASGSATAGFSRAYTLADITACSSAFYAAALAEPLRAAVSSLLALDDDKLHGHFGKLMEKESSISAKLHGKFADFLETEAGKVFGDIRSKLSELEKDINILSPDDLVPQYNYWPLDLASQGAKANQKTLFTDGGDLENTGIAGLLAQLGENIGNIIAFVNGAEVLEVKNGVIVAAPQMAPLFGIAYNEKTSEFAKYQAGAVNPFTRQIDPMGFLQVFDNSNNEFDALRNGLYAANGKSAKSAPAFYQQTLKVVPNKLLGVTVSYTVNVLWIQNAEVGNWQKQISDSNLKQKIADGQKKGGKTEFAGFPYYSTFKKIHQTEAETNTLAQMWSWCVGSEESPLSVAIKKMFAYA